MNNFPPAPPPSLLEVTGLDVFYGDFQALFGVSLAVPPGGATALVGANGAGKTTLLRAIAGAQPAAAGSVRYGGDDLTAAPPHRRIARGVALVPEGRKLFPSLTVEENIQVGAAAAAASDWPLDRIYGVFPMLASRRGQRAWSLSGGEQQAVAIARALAASPSLLLLDEISLGLAPRVVGELYQTLAGLREAGATLVIVEQDLRRAMEVCDDLVCLLEGRVALAARVASVSREQVVAAYFGESSAHGPHRPLNPTNPTHTPSLQDPQNPTHTPSLQDPQNPTHTPSLQDPQNPTHTPSLQDPRDQERGP